MKSSFLKDLSVGRRLVFGFGSLIVMLATLTGLNALALREIGGQLGRIVEINNPKSELAHQMLNHINEMSVQVRNITLLSDVKEMEAEVKVLNRALEDYGQSEKLLAASIGSPGGESEEASLMSDISTSARATVPLLLRAAKEGQDGASNEATMTLMMRVRPAERIWREKVSHLVQVETRISQAANERTKASQSRALSVSLLVLTGAVFMGSVLGWRITRSVKRPIDDAIRVAERIAEGDLSSTINVQARDEIGRLVMAISGMQDRLRLLVGQIRESATNIQAASTEVASGNQDLSARTELAAANLQRTASSMEQMTATVQQSAHSARVANGLASTASGVAVKGGEMVRHVVSTMDAIKDSSQRIADIIAVIDGIAFQTNILALNAAVEAARAGEEGRGFAVVAGEVRTLASRSADAAKQIKTLIGASVEKVEGGSRLVRDAGSTMAEIVASVEQVAKVINEVTTAATEQSSGIGQINDAVTELDHMTQQNAALVEQSAAAAQSLQQQATNLAEMVASFRLGR